MAAYMKRVREALRPSFWKRFIFDPCCSLPALVLLFIAEIAVNIFVILKIKCEWIMSCFCTGKGVPGGWKVAKTCKAGIILTQLKSQSVLIKSV
jgi:hypothetical protein